MQALSDEYCVVSMDLPGFGLTGPYTDEMTRYNSANYAKFVIQVLDSLNLKKVTLAGNSLGAKSLGVQQLYIQTVLISLS